MKPTKPPVYISVSIVRDGPIPVAYSMLHLSAVAFDQDGRELDTFSTNIQALPGAESDPMFLEHLGEDGIEKLKTDAEDAYGASINFAYWVVRQRGRAVFVSTDAANEFGFINWYLRKYAKASPFADMLDVGSFMLGRGAKEFPQSYYDVHRSVSEDLRVSSHDTGNQILDHARWTGQQMMNLLNNKKIY